MCALTPLMRKELAQGYKLLSLKEMNAVSILLALCYKDLLSSSSCSVITAVYGPMSTVSAATEHLYM